MKTIPQLIIDLLKTEMRHKFKLYREGDPIIPPQGALPALFITETETNYSLGATMHDRIEHRLLIQVVLDKKAEFGNPDASLSLDKKLDQIIQDRDDNGYFKSGTMMKVLRENYTLGKNMLIENISTVRKGVVPRTEEIVTTEGHVDLTIVEEQPMEART